MDVHREISLISLFTYYVCRLIGYVKNKLIVTEIPEYKPRNPLRLNRNLGSVLDDGET